MNNDYPWADIEYEKEIREEKPRKKENYKDEKRDNLVSKLFIYFARE